MDNYLAASRLAKYSPQALACVAWRFWLGALNNKGGRGQRKREEIEAGATWKIFTARSSAFLRLRRSVVLQTKPPCYAGYTSQRTFFRPERPTLPSRGLQSITQPFQKRFREGFGNARILIFKSHLGWFFLVFGEGKGTKENMWFFWFIWPLTCICKQKTVLPVSSINLSQTDKALPVKTSEPNFVTFFRSSLFDYLWNFFVCYGSKAWSHFVRNHGLLVRWAPVVTYNFDILKFILCCEAWRIITKEIVLRLINE